MKHTLYRLRQLSPDFGFFFYNDSRYAQTTCDESDATLATTNNYNVRLFRVSKVGFFHRVCSPTQPAFAVLVDAVFDAFWSSCPIFASSWPINSYMCSYEQSIGLTVTIDSQIVPNLIHPSIVPSVSVLEASSFADMMMMMMMELLLHVFLLKSKKFKILSFTIIKECAQSINDLHTCSTAAQN